MTRIELIKNNVLNVLAMGRLTEDEVELALEIEPRMIKFLFPYVNIMEALEETGYDYIEFIDTEVPVSLNSYFDFDEMACTTTLDMHEVSRKIDSYSKMGTMDILDLLYKYPNVINMISNPEEELMLAMVEYDASYIQYMTNAPVSVQLKVVNLYPAYISLIKNPCKEVQELVVDFDPEYIQFIQEPELNIQLRAVRNSINSIYYIRKVHTDVISYVLSQI